MQRKRSHSKRRRSSGKDRILDRPKLFFILLGTISILFGVFIGDVKIGEQTFPFYYPIAFGLFLELLSILIFVKQKQIKI
ncbi:hypothetical protein AXE80_04750 [Wenyingzhuangia fucanilytica]|uniref:DUF3098 domain-containing protein n=1 Tax=Wenyingzhuangia fucanilytica TaxID=1790137 RepID=A0A1B1Y4G2_9FLAO|nr:hypothetical protein [Wenyingzhuangia fucanilytica]ANW95628.1 hypothetical protein AXE80_04750 [Wenyingzhuangia fucanilytica]